MIEFHYEHDIAAVAILGAVEDLGLDFFHEPGVIFVDIELSSELSYILTAITDLRASTVN